MFEGIEMFPPLLWNGDMGFTQNRAIGMFEGIENGKQSNRINCTRLYTTE